MNSHCYKNHTTQEPGGPLSSPGATPPATPEAAHPAQRTDIPQPATADLPGLPRFRYCANVTAAGRHCRMLAGIDSDFCPHHARPRAKRVQDEQEGKEAEVFAAELLGPVKDFNTPGNVHHFLGNVIQQYARKRIPRRDALTSAISASCSSAALASTASAQQGVPSASKSPLCTCRRVPHPRFVRVGLPPGLLAVPLPSGPVCFPLGLG